MLWRPWPTHDTVIALEMDGEEHRATCVLSKKTADSLAVSVSGIHRFALFGETKQPAENALPAFAVILRGFRRTGKPFVTNFQQSPRVTAWFEIPAHDCFEISGPARDPGVNE